MPTMPATRPVVTATTPWDQLPVLLTVAEVQALSGYSFPSLYKAINAGRLRACRPMHHWRVHRDDFVAWMEGAQ